MKLKEKLAREYYQERGGDIKLLQATPFGFYKSETTADKGLEPEVIPVDWKLILDSIHEIVGEK